MKGSKALIGLLNHRLHLAFIGDIGLHEQDLCPQFLQCLDLLYLAAGTLHRFMAHKPVVPGFLQWEF